MDRINDITYYKTKHVNINTSQKLISNAQISKKATAYNANLSDSHGSSFRAQLFGIHIASVAFASNLSLTIYTYPESVAITFKKQRERKVTACGQSSIKSPAEWCLWEMITRKYKKRLAMKWIKGHNNTPLDKPADKFTNNEASDSQLGYTNKNFTNIKTIKSVWTEFLYPQGNIVNGDFGTFIKKIVQLKKAIYTE
jgi:hypothetical protein